MNPDDSTAPMIHMIVDIFMVYKMRVIISRMCRSVKVKGGDTGLALCGMLYSTL